METFQGYGTNTSDTVGVLVSLLAFLAPHTVLSCCDKSHVWQTAASPALLYLIYFEVGLSRSEGNPDLRQNLIRLYMGFADSQTTHRWKALVLLAGN